MAPPDQGDRQRLLIQGLRFGVLTLRIVEVSQAIALRSASVEL